MTMLGTLTLLQLALGGGKSTPIPIEIATIGSVGLAAMGCYVLRGNWLPAERRMRWGKRGEGAPLSRVACIAWSIAMFAWSLGLASPALGDVVSPKLTGWIIGVATAGIFIAMLHDGWAADGYRIW